MLPRWLLALMVLASLLSLATFALLPLLFL